MDKPGLLKRVITGAKMWSYHAILDRKKRTPPKTTTQSEDAYLSANDRRKLIATAREQQRNIALIAWMVRKHLDYVSRFKFQANTGNKELDNTLESLVTWWSRKEQCDISMRHSFQEITRLIESHRTIDGDGFIIKLKNGRLQGIEGDRVGAPTQGELPDRFKNKNITQGIELDDFGAARSYIVLKRVERKRLGFLGASSTALEFDKVVLARNMIQVGYFNRFDQVRGVSPMSVSINIVQDLYESFDAQLIKNKMTAMFGIAIKRDSTDDDDVKGFVHTDRETSESPTSSTNTYDYDITPGLKLELEPGDSIDTIESKNPSNEFVQYTEQMTKVAMLALDIPFSFYDSRQSSYSAQRQDLLQYNESAKGKRERIRDFLNEIIAWKVGMWTKPAENGTTLLPLPAGMESRDVKWNWIPTGIPWIDPLKEMGAHQKSIMFGLRSRQEIAAERGLDWRVTAQQLADEEQELVDLGVTVQLSDPGALTTREESIAEGIETDDENEDDDNE